MKDPLAITVFWHPDYKDGLDYAELIFSEFNRKVTDPLARGMNIPIFFSQKLPFPSIPFDDYEFAVVVVLIDSTFVLDEKYQEEYPNSFKRLITTFSTNVLLIPVAIDKSAFSLGLGNLNFFRLYEKENRRDFLVNTLAHEITRHLYHLETERVNGSPPPLRLFISHAKIDGVDIAKQIKAFVDASLPLQTFFDANDISIGYDFSKEIELNIKDAVVIAIHSDNYSSREWCRREVLLAKQHNRPIVVLNCFKDGESRSFPYMANVLTVHFASIDDATLPRLITAVMKETLRLKYQEYLISYIAQKYGYFDVSQSISAYPPELVTVLKKRKILNNVFIYPDPPIGTEELSIIQDIDPNIRFITPSDISTLKMREGTAKGKVIGISISESSDMENFGMSYLHLQNNMVEIARYLLHKGFTLAYGGDLNYESHFNFVEILFQLGMTYGGNPNQRIINYSAFPLYTKISKNREAEISKMAKIKRINPSSEYDNWLNVRYETANSEQRKYLDWIFDCTDDKAKEIWTKSLTKMRQAMTNEISARIVVGGKTKNYLGKMPGIEEEAILCVENDVTVYVNETFGGASAEFLKKESVKGRFLNLNEKIRFYPGKERFLELEGFLQSQL